MRNPRAPSRPMSRATAVARMRARLLRDSFPRVQMFILVSLTGLAGFGASVAMLGAGVDAMALRYVLAMGVAYIVFLLLLWLWLRTSAADYLDAGAYHEPGGAKESAGQEFTGGGGSFDGGGASGNVDIGTQDSVIDTIADKPLAAIGHADEGAIPLAVILLVLGIALSSLFVVWSAPLLFAEILVDALLATGLYRRLRVLEPRHWMVGAVKRTLLPFVLTTLFVGAVGWGMQAYAPEARSLGEVLASR